MLLLVYFDFLPLRSLFESIILEKVSFMIELHKETTKSINWIFTHSYYGTAIVFLRIIVQRKQNIMYVVFNSLWLRKNALKISCDSFMIKQTHSKEVFLDNLIIC